jgi:hypothetical protein
LHAGPQCTKFRAVLFFTAHPPPSDQHTDDTDTYHPDQQVFEGTLLFDIVISIWESITYKDRLAILYKVEESMARYKGLPDHYVQDVLLSGFLKKLASTENSVEKEELMEKFARNSLL